MDCGEQRHSTHTAYTAHIQLTQHTYSLHSLRAVCMAWDHTNSGQQQERDGVGVGVGGGGMGRGGVAGYSSKLRAELSKTSHNVMTG